MAFTIRYMFTVVLCFCAMTQYAQQPPHDRVVRFSERPLPGSTPIHISENTHISLNGTRLNLHHVKADNGTISGGGVEIDLVDGSRELINALYRMPAGKEVFGFDLTFNGAMVFGLGVAIVAWFCSVDISGLFEKENKP